MNVEITIEELELILTLLQEDDAKESLALYEKLVNIAPARPENA